MSKLVTIIGGSGFVGRYIARRMAKDGWRVRVAVRRPNEAIFVRPYGAVGQVEPVLCNIRNDASIAQAVAGADAVINCVGILARDGKNTFDAVQAEGAARAARAAAEAGVQHFVHISAIGADANAESAYSRTKAEGEAAVIAAFPSAVILRPSVIFGNEDGFFNRFGKMASRFPILGITAANTKFQPVYVDDVAAAAVIAANGCAAAGVYELGGPEVDTMRGLMVTMCNVINRKPLIVNMPRFAAGLMAGALDLAQTVTMGLFHNGILTRDQLINLQKDNVVSEGAKTFADLGIVPTSMNAVLPSYLWPFRPSGQYDAIKASAKNLRT